jgi:uncharacterized protein
MSLNPDAQIDTGQVEDRRGSGGGFGIPISFGGGGGRGGLVGLIVTVLLVLVGGGFGASQLLGGDNGGGADNGNLNQTCSTANPNRLQNLDCRNTLYVNSIQNFWQTELPQVYGQQYQPAKTVFFSQRTQTGCGAADSGTGPFYCPVDKLVYIDLTFYTQLTEQFGAKGEFAQPYVLAHEYGHHVQDLLGTMDQVDRLRQRDPGSDNRYSVMLELQADCFSGVWSAHATQTKDASGHPIFTQVSPQNIQDAVTAAGAVGDDTIERKAGQQVNPDTFTHGTSAQREEWFSRGYQSGDPKACNTFGTSLGG